MDSIPIRTIVEVVGGRWLGPGPAPDWTVREVSTDTRTISAGSLFVPLRGQRFDGREFIGEALRRGAAAAFVETGTVLDDPQAPVIGVENAQEALERLACYWRAEVGALTFAITGTVGKTTTKEFLGILLATRFPTVRAPKSFNNRLGVSLTLLSASRSTRCIVSEVGSSGPGEISLLSKLVKPSHAIVTEIGQAHIAGLGSLEGVIREKSGIFDGLAPGGTAFINEGAPGRYYLAERAQAAGGKVVLFGWDRGDYRIAECRRLLRGELNLPPGEVPAGFRFRVRDPGGFEEEFVLAVPGKHNVLNALAAIAAAREAGLDWAAVRAGVREFSLPPRRFQIGSAAGVTLIDDTYNASHRSVLAALDEAGELPVGTPQGRRILVLGDLLDLGTSSEGIHAEIGRRAATCGRFHGLAAVGQESRFAARAFEEAARASGGSIDAWYFETVEQVAPFLASRLSVGDLALFKASRAVGLDRAVEETRRLLLLRSEGAAGNGNGSLPSSLPGPGDVPGADAGAAASTALRGGRASCSTISVN